MNITNVPEIIGPNFGGIIYGLTFKHGYSTAPSELTLNIVSRNGQYNIGENDLNQLQTIKFGGFKFTGYVWEYNIKTSSDESLLEVKLLDGSIILDRYWVMLWKRGLLDNDGTLINELVTFDFTDETELVPFISNNEYGKISFVEQNLGTSSLSIPYYSFAKRINNILLIGKEQVPDNPCDIPTTDYNFLEFQSICPVPTTGLLVDPEYRNTYEGRLRDVLNSWCESSGYSFFWDFSTNQIKYYDSSRGFVSVLPDIEDKSIISKDKSFSLKGTFRQFAVSWAARPKQPIKTLSGSASIQQSMTVLPYPLSFFAGKEAKKASLIGKSGRFGKDRGENTFIESAAVGSVSKDLRDIYNIMQGYLHVLGIVGLKVAQEEKSKVLEYLTSKGFEGVNELSEISRDVRDIDIIIGDYNEKYADTWHSIEQELLPKIGSFYKIGLQSKTFYFCKSDSFTTISITVDPEPSIDEEAGSDFSGSKIFNRGGAGITPTGSVALEELKYDGGEVQSMVNLLQLRIIPTKESGIYEDIKNLGLRLEDPDRVAELGDAPPSEAEAAAKSFANIILLPNSKLIRDKLQFSVVTERGVEHPTEANIRDIAAAKQENQPNECETLEDTKKQGSCQSYEDIARENALRAILPDTTRTQEKYSGLTNSECTAIRINILGSGRTKIYLPSESPYQVIIKAETQTERVSFARENQLLYSEGTINSSVNDVEQIEVIFDNVTDSKFEKFRSSARKARLPTAKNIVANKPLSKISYVFAGEPTISDLTPNNGIESLDVSLSSDGFKTSVSFSNRAPKRGNIDGLMSKINSQFKRSAYNGG